MLELPGVTLFGQTREPAAFPTEKRQLRYEAYNIAALQHRW